MSSTELKECKSKWKSPWYEMLTETYKPRASLISKMRHAARQLHFISKFLRDLADNEPCQG